MAVFDALRRTPDALRRNPVLFVPVLVVALFQLPQLVLQGWNPLLASLVSFGFSLVYLVAVPFFQGGLLGMADEALDGVTSLGSFLREGRANYVSMLVAYLLVLAVSIVLVIVGVLGAVFGGALLFVGGGQPGVAQLAVLGVVGLVILLAYLTLVFFVQFYGQAIVLEDCGAIDGLRRSVGLVRRNLLSALGYSVLVGVLGGVVGLFLGAVSLLSSPESAALLGLPQPSIAVVAAASLVVVIGAAALGTLLAVYSVAFYRAISRGSNAA
jgi:hypothetical protein